MLILGKNLSNVVPPFEISTTRIAIVKVVEFQALGVHNLLKLDLIWSKYSNFVNIITPKHSICNESFDEFLSNFECPSMNIHNSYCSTGYPSKAFKEKKAATSLRIKFLGI